MTVSLIDDGTMDTVFECDVCGKEIRYSEVERDEYGDVLESEYERVAEEHADECGPMTLGEHEIEWNARQDWLDSQRS